MIGFRPPSTNRRPIYSLTGQKLCYVVSGPRGDEFYSLSGKRLAKVVRWKKRWSEMCATQAMAGTVVMTPEDVE